MLTAAQSRARVVVALIAGLIIGLAWAGIYSTTPANQGAGAWRTNRLTGAMTYCTIERDPPGEAFGRRFVGCLED